MRYWSCSILIYVYRRDWIKSQPDDTIVSCSGWNSLVAQHLASIDPHRNCWEHLKCLLAAK